MATDTLTNSARDDTWLRSLLVLALRDQGLGSLCKGEPATHDQLSARLSTVLMSAFGLGVVFSLSDWLDANASATLAIMVGGLLVLGVVGWRRSVNSAALLLVLVWTMCVIVQVVLVDHDLWATILVPFLLTGAAVLIIRTRRLAIVARSAPLVLPVTLSILVIPLFTNDLWSAAQGLHPGNLVVVAALSLLPLLIAVEHRLRREVDGAIAEAAASLDVPGRQAELEQTLIRLLPEEERDAAADDVERLLVNLWVPFESEPAVRALSGPMRRRLWRLVALVAIGLTTTASLYMGALAWTLIPIDNAREWTGVHIQAEHVAILGLAFDVPLGAYVTVAVLLGLLAAAVLLASAAVDEDYAKRLAAALLREPAEEALLTLIPYLRLSEREPAALAEAT